MLKKFFVVNFFILLSAQHISAQELQAHITVNASRVGSQTDRKVFQTLQSALNNFLNSRKWTKETFQPGERVVCNFLLNITQAENNVFQSSLTVQAARPV